jgi:activating signal cointegrator complex subunit 3
VRPEEQTELDVLQQKCPLELAGPINDSVTKTFVLMQMYISRIRPKSFTLISDTNYIVSNAGKVPREMISCLLDVPFISTSRLSTFLQSARCQSNF